MDTRMGWIDPSDKVKLARQCELSGVCRATWYNHQAAKPMTENDLLDEKALKLAELNDGKLLLVSNVTDLTPPEIIARYKALADIELGFRVLKDEIEIGPIYHRLPKRIRAHATICFIALNLHRIIRQRLKVAGSPLSPKRALQMLAAIQKHTVHMGANATTEGLSNISTEQSSVYSALKAKKPTSKHVQLSLLWWSV